MCVAESKRLFDPVLFLAQPIGAILAKADLCGINNLLQINPPGSPVWRQL